MTTNTQQPASFVDRATDNAVRLTGMPRNAEYIALFRQAITEALAESGPVAWFEKLNGKVTINLNNAGLDLPEGERWLFTAPQPDSRNAEIVRLQEALDNEHAKGVHSCGPTCTNSACVNRKLRDELAAAKVLITDLSADLCSLLTGSA